MLEGVLPMTKLMVGEWCLFLIRGLILMMAVLESGWSDNLHSGLVLNKFAHRGDIHSSSLNLNGSYLIIYAAFCFIY